MLYLVNAVTGFFGIAFVPGKLVVCLGTPRQQPAIILASEELFRLGIVSD